MKQLVIATRASALALAQTESIAERLKLLHPGLDISLKTITTTGDKILDRPLAKVGGKGLFVKEIEEALLKHEAHLAVHSMKDMPFALPAGLALGAITEREDPRDALIARSGGGLAGLPFKARVGTSSLRRKVQLLALRPDLEIVPLRGNVQTRLKKLRTENLDAVVLALAGIKRLQLSIEAWPLELEQMLPAVGQGALALELRQDDAETRRLIQPLHHEVTAKAVEAERAFLGRLEGSCQTPIAGYAWLKGEMVELAGLVADISGCRVIKAQDQAPGLQAQDLGRRLAEHILAAGGREIMAELAADH